MQYIVHTNNKYHPHVMHTPTPFHNRHIIKIHYKTSALINELKGIGGKKKHQQNHLCSLSLF
jgi:hypothetical protein